MGNTILLSPQVIYNVDDMKLPDVYRERYLEETDTLRRIMRMYHTVISDDRPPNTYFNPDLIIEKVSDICKVVELISSRGDETKARRISDIIERRTRLAETLSNLSLNFDHGAKRETIIEKFGTRDKSVVQKLLTDMVNAKVLERVALGYYRIPQKYWVNKPDSFREIVYPEKPPTKRMHENIKEKQIKEDLIKSSEFKSQYRQRQATTLLQLISNQHIATPYCARAQDILQLRRLFGEEVTENQNKRDLEALMKLGDDIYGPLIERFRPAGMHGVFFKMTDDYVGPMF